MTHPLAGFSRPTTRWLRVVFGVIGLLSLVLGYLGFERLMQARPENLHDRYDVLYYDIQLFVLGAEPFQEPGPYPWQLQVARFTAPLFTLLAVVEASRLLLAAEIRRLRARRARGHALVCGDSQFAQMLADRLFADGERVVVVRSEPFGPLEYRQRRYLGVVGDPTSAEVLRGAGLPMARTVYACTGNDDRNHAIANTASRLIHDRGQPPRVYIQVHDPEMCLSLQARRLGAAGSSRLRLDYFHVDDIAARALHEHHPLRGPVPGRPTKVLIAGTGAFRRALLVETARHWRKRRADLGSGEPVPPLYVDLVAPDASAELALTAARYPFLTTVCRLAAHDLDLDRLTGLPHVATGGYDRIYLCGPDERRGLQFVLDSPALWRGAESSVFVPVYRQAALAAAFHGDSRHDLLDEVHGKLRLYPVLTRACDARLIAEDLTERLAQQIHDRYLRAQRRAGVRPGDAPAMVDWSRLPESLRRANRAHVQDIAAKLLNLGCVVAPRQGGAGDASAAGQAIDDRIDELAQLEHERWCRERQGEGWTYGEPRDDVRRRHPALRPWHELTPDLQEQNREEIRALPDVLSDSGFELIRLAPAVPAQRRGSADGA
ncbi:RyR domain-containing protein [Micromonospora narathiwatensis]|uniref:RyR domain-containing protein n=1 Tax=Micromonospora narathiwatensis TaxID=299146 RepID=A0A1A8ZLC4_9ACTN|nr:RyR domain-containing protein [Micromonospora narathiwatensis]SBT44674.1 RyR domain-containing protein [Micromonospora narathiwatensis]